MDVVEGPAPKPEAEYRKATDPAERRRLQAAVIEAYRVKVASLVRRTVPKQHRSEAEQVGLLGLLVALEKYDPTPREGYAVGPAFWSYASAWVLDELQTWMDVGIYWRKAANRGASPERKAARAAAEASRKHALCDDLTHVEDATPTVEEQASDLEVLGLLKVFAATLTDEERSALFAESPRPTRHYRSLVERATAFVRGNEGDGSGSAVFRCADATRLDDVGQAGVDARALAERR